MKSFQLAYETCMKLTLSTISVMGFVNCKSINQNRSSVESQSISSEGTNPPGAIKTWKCVSPSYVAVKCRDYVFSGNININYRDHGAHTKKIADIIEDSVSMF